MRILTRFNGNNVIDRLGVIFLALLLLFIACYYPAERTGDGAYYYAQLIAFYEYGHPYVSDGVNAQVLQRTGVNAQEILTSVGKDGHIYTWHFWFYSLVCLPAFFVLKSLGLDTLQAFQITNALLCIAALYCLFSSASLCRASKWFIALCFVFSTGAMYLLWTHPEIYSSALLLIACCQLLRRQYAWTAVWVALASYQNPSLAFFLFPVYFYQFFIAYRSDWQQGLWRVAKRFSPTFMASFLVLLPYVWSKSVMGVFNPIADSDYVNYSYVRISRWLSLLFDLNQGVLVALPAVVVLIGVLFFYRLWQFRKYKKNLVFADIFLVAFVFMSLPVLAQNNWNPGQSAFLRYVCWLSIPLLFWVALHLNSFRHASWVVLAVALVQLPLAFYYGTHHALAPGAYLQFKPWVSVVWRINPHRYNPAPMVFFNRLHQKELPISTPAIFTNDEQTILKVLTQQSTMQKTMEEVCGVGSKLVPIDTRPSSQARLSKPKEGYAYLTGRLKCEYMYPLALPLTLNSLAPLYLGQGWSHLESWGVWSEGNTAVLNLKTLHPDKPVKLRIQIEAETYVNEKHPLQRVGLTVAGQPAATWEVHYPESKLVESVVVSLNAGQDMPLVFSLPDAISPHTVGESTDTRLLGIGLKALKIEVLDD